MKLKRIKKPQHRLLELQILKLCYKKKSYNFGTHLKQMEIQLRKISDVIYKYHIMDKKILFLGFPVNFNETLKNTKHILIPESVWVDGMLSNRTSSINSSVKKTPKSVFKLMLKLEKKLDLVVIYNLNKSSTAIKESYLARTPAITFSKKSDTFDLETTYDSIGNYSFINEKLENKNFFLSFIKSTLNRAKRSKRVKSYKSLNELREVYKKRNNWNAKKVSWKDKKAQPYKKHKRFIKKN